MQPFKKHSVPHKMTPPGMRLTSFFVYFAKFFASLSLILF